MAKGGTGVLHLVTCRVQLPSGRDCSVVNKPSSWFEFKKQFLRTSDNYENVPMAFLPNGIQLCIIDII